MTTASVYQQLRTHLSFLGMRRAAEVLSVHLEQAEAEGLGCTAFLEKLLAEEVAATEARRLKGRLRFSHFPVQKRLSVFDFDAQPGIDRKMVEELATLRFIEEKANVLLVGGPPWTEMEISQARQAALRLSQEIGWGARRETLESDSHPTQSPPQINLVASSIGLILNTMKHSDQLKGRTGYVGGVFLYKGKTAAEWIPKVVERIVERFDPLKIVLFGSQGRNQVGPDSDIDLLVVLPHVENKRAAAASILTALADLPAPVDIIVTDPDEIARRGNLVGTVLWPALREGKVLHERSG